jgi:adenylosuccinate lyase
MSNDVIPDTLADRYASPPMRALWSPRNRVVLERELWITVMQAQRELGLDIPAEAIAAYEKVKDQVDLDSIRARERVTRHDVKARIDEFCALAGHEHIHKGMTSRDATENVEQTLILRSLELVREHYGACLHRLSQRVRQYRSLALTARTHNVPAQMTTVGKRLANFGTEMLLAFDRLEELIASYPLRGIKGPVGTQLDMLTLFGGDQKKVATFEQRIAQRLGFLGVLDAVGQVYPRSLDFAVVSVLFQLASGPSSLAKTLRLMAGYELASEGFGADQVGSSAMPHKMNARSCERVNGLQHVLGGFLNMTVGVSGDQWNEGDVSCSVVRRVALPGAFFAIDGLCETFLTVLGEMEMFPESIGAERERYLPFLATTTILMEAVQAGAGREAAHAAIRDHALAVARDLRTRAVTENDLVERVARDPRIGIDAVQLKAALSSDQRFTGAALAQADAFVEQVAAIAKRLPELTRYAPGEIL